MGIESHDTFFEEKEEEEEISYQRIKDNVDLLSDETVKKLNMVIVDFGHQMFKKKEVEVLHLKTDSFVVESNVHFPTDYKLLGDASRKAIDMVTKLLEKHKFTGWRKVNDWRGGLKGLMPCLSGRQALFG